MSFTFWHSVVTSGPYQELVVFWDNAVASFDWRLLLQVFFLTILVRMFLNLWSQKLRVKIVRWMAILLVMVVLAGIWQIDPVVYLGGLGVLGLIIFMLVEYRGEVLDKVQRTATLNLRPTGQSRRNAQNIVTAAFALSKNRIPSGIAILPDRTLLPKNLKHELDLGSNPATYENLINLFRDSKSSSAKGLAIVHKGEIAASGVNLAGHGKKQLFNVSNTSFQHFAKKHGGIIIVTSGHTSKVAAIYRSDVFKQVTQQMLERIILESWQ